MRCISLTCKLFSSLSVFVAPQGCWLQFNIYCINSRNRGFMLCFSPTAEYSHICSILCSLFAGITVLRLLLLQTAADRVGGGGTCRAAELHHTEMMMFIGVWSFFRQLEAELARRRITFLISETALAHRLSFQRSGSPLWGLVILLLLFQTAVILNNKLKNNNLKKGYQNRGSEKLSLPC